MAELIKLGSQADMLFTPRAGYITKTLALNESGDVVELVKKSDGSIVSVGGGGGSSDGYVVVEDGGVLKAQKLTFDGTTASDDGNAEEIGTVGIFATGKEEPAYKGSGGGSFYKCASVDGGTWSGYKAVIDGETGVWSFSEEVTSGLSYNKIVPQVGKVYDEECTFIVSGFIGDMPSDGLVFYASFRNSNTAETGQVYDKRGEGHRFETIDGIPCYNCTEGESHQIYIDNSSVQFPTNGKPYTVCAWARVTTDATNPLWYIGVGENPNETILWIDSNLSVNHYSEGYAIIEGRQKNVWYFWCETFDGTTCHGYGKRIDDTELTTASRNVNIQIPDNFYFQFGGIRGTGDWAREGAISSARVYNRVLTMDEIMALSNEFTA